MPLLLMHGWPGSVYEFIDIIPRLTDPARFGGDPADAFTVIAPSLPGYGLSFKPGQKRFSIEDIAACFSSLMTDVLGYRRYGAQGGDYGAFTASRLGHAHSDSVIGIHINLLTIQRDRPPPANPTEEERRYFEELAAWLKEETGYQWIQGTKPQTLAYGLTDSPAGLLAWIAEKFRTWSDCGGDPESAISRDHLLANVSLYWFTGAIGSSFWPYYARLHGQWPIPSRRHGRCANGLRGVPEGDHPRAALHRAANVYEHPTLDRYASGRPFRRDGTATGFGGGDPGVFPSVAVRGLGGPLGFRRSCG